MVRTAPYLGHRGALAWVPLQFVILWPWCAVTSPFYMTLTVLNLGVSEVSTETVGVGMV